MDLGMGQRNNPAMEQQGNDFMIVDQEQPPKSATSGKGTKRKLKSPTKVSGIRTSTRSAAQKFKNSLGSHTAQNEDDEF